MATVRHDPREEEAQRAKNKRLAWTIAAFALAFYVFFIIWNAVR
jgi:uncharacterized membrane protein (DUF485 family)